MVIKQVFLFVLFFLVLLKATVCLAADPVISPSPVSAVFVTGSYVTWETDIASNSKIDYGTTTAYGLNVSNVSNVTHHVLTITGLSANTTYHYKVTSGASSSGDFTFTTYANPTGTVKTVKPSGGDYTTVSACSSAAAAGWTCLVYDSSGTYSAATPNSGSMNNYVTILAQEAATIYGFTVGNKNYVAIKGFEIIGTGIAGGGTAAHITVENNYIHNTNNSCVNPRDNYASDWWVVRNNIMYACGYVGLMISGTSTLIEGNDISHQVNDCIYDGGLTNSVIRNNTCHDYDPQGSGQHLDFVQWDDGGTVAPFTESLIEGNTILRCGDSTHNCHVVILRNPGPGTAAQHPIIRYNFASHIDGGGFMMGGGSSDSIPYSRIYNNTLATEYSPTSCGDATGQFATFYHGDFGKLMNNISYNSCDTSCSPFDLATGGANNYNIAYDSGNPTASWLFPYTEETTFNSLKNKNPTFTNYPYGAAIASNSPAVDVGGALTTVTSGCGTNTLVLGDARWFQSGWAGTSADYIAVGNISNSVQISSINYNSNITVLASSVSCANGDSVWLYKKSDGVQVLSGLAPDIGAYEFVEGGGDEASPASPGGLSVR